MPLLSGHVLHEPVDRVVGVGRVIDGRRILRPAQRAVHHVVALRPVLAAHVLHRTDVAALDDDVGGVVVALQDRPEMRAVRVARERGGAVRRAREEDGRPRCALRHDDDGVQLHAVAHRDHHVALDVVEGGGHRHQLRRRFGGQARARGRRFRNGLRERPPGAQGADREHGHQHRAAGNIRRRTPWNRVIEVSPVMVPVSGDCRIHTKPGAPAPGRRAARLPPGATSAPAASNGTPSTVTLVLVRTESRRARLGVDPDAAQRDGVGVDRHQALARGHPDVLEHDPADRHLGQALQHHRAAGAPAEDAREHDVAELRRAFVHGHRRTGRGRVVGGLGRRLAAVVHVEADGVGGDVGHLHVADPDLLDDAAPPARGLEAHADVRAQERAALDEDVAHAARHLAAHGESAVAVIDDVVRQ